jgi:hypothetical protein
MQDGMGKVLGMVADFMFSCMKKSREVELEMWLSGRALA